jgi:hypothetical protein
VIDATKRVDFNSLPFGPDDYVEHNCYAKLIAPTPQSPLGLSPEKRQQNVFSIRIFLRMRARQISIKTRGQVAKIFQKSFIVIERRVS